MKPFGARKFMSQSFRLLCTFHCLFVISSCCIQNVTHSLSPNKFLQCDNPSRALTFLHTQNVARQSRRIDCIWLSFGGSYPHRKREKVVEVCVPVHHHAPFHQPSNVHASIPVFLSGKSSRKADGLGITERFQSFSSQNLLRTTLSVTLENLQQY